MKWGRLFGRCLLTHIHESQLSTCMAWLGTSRRCQVFVKGSLAQLFRGAQDDGTAVAHKRHVIFQLYPVPELALSTLTVLEVVPYGGFLGFSGKNDSSSTAGPLPPSPQHHPRLSQPLHARLQLYSRIRCCCCANFSADRLVLELAIHGHLSAKHELIRERSQHISNMNSKSDRSVDTVIAGGRGGGGGVHSDVSGWGLEAPRRRVISFYPKWEIPKGIASDTSKLEDVSVRWRF